MIIEGFIWLNDIIEKNEVKRNGKTNNLRKLSSVILHECTHRYLFKKYGLFKITKITSINKLLFI